MRYLKFKVLTNGENRKTRVLVVDEKTGEELGEISCRKIDITIEAGQRNLVVIETFDPIIAPFEP